jgi:glycosyltransferase involved in cell wall biosynthesis
VYRLPVRHYRRGVGRYLFEFTASFLLAFFSVGWLHLRKRFDIVEVDSIPDFLVFSSLIPKLMGARIVLYLFETMPEYFALKYGLPTHHWAVRLMEWFEQRAIGYADHAITADEAFRGAMVTRGTPSHKISVILNVPNDAAFRTACEAYSPVNEKRGFIVITHGTLLDLYGIQFMIQAIANLRSQIPGLQLVIAGDGEYGSELKRLAQELQVTDIVQFTGWIPQHEVIHLILRADVGVVATFGSYGEMCVPNKLFEYIALGKPVVCSSLRAIRDYFDDNALAYFQPGSAEQLAQCILKVYRQPALAAQIVEHATRVYQENRWEVTSITYLDVLTNRRG